MSIGFPSAMYNLFGTNLDGCWGERFAATYYSGWSGVEEGSLVDAVAKHRLCSRSDFDGLFRVALSVLPVNRSISIQSFRAADCIVKGLSDYVPCGYGLIRHRTICGNIWNYSNLYGFVLIKGALSLCPRR